MFICINVCHSNFTWLIVRTNQLRRCKRLHLHFIPITETCAIAAHCCRDWQFTILTHKILSRAQICCWQRIHRYTSYLLRATRMSICYSNSQFVCFCCNFCRIKYWTIELNTIQMCSTRAFPHRCVCFNINFWRQRQIRSGANTIGVLHGNCRQWQHRHGNSFRCCTIRCIGTSCRYRNDIVTNVSHASQYTRI